MRSDLIKKGFDKAPHRSLLKATGQIKSDGDFEKPFIGIANANGLVPINLFCMGNGATLGPPPLAKKRDVKPFLDFLLVLEKPFDEVKGNEAYATPGPVSDIPYQTFCGT